MFYQELRRSVYRLVGRELSKSIAFFDKVCYSGGAPEEDILFGLVPHGTKARIDGPISLPGADAAVAKVRRFAILLNGTFNCSLDIQSMLSEFKQKMTRGDRIFAILYNPYLSFIYRAADRLGWRKSSEATTFVTETDLNNIARLSGFEVVRMTHVAGFPFHLWGLGRFLDAFVSHFPGLRHLSPVCVAVLRPVMEDHSRLTLSIVIPARNEKGNIETAIKRLPNLANTDLEIIFVEGHSNDGTWEEIKRVENLYGDKVKIQTHKQTGKGKSNAVRIGFAHATGDLLTILDADLTMPPELLYQFVDAYRQGLGDFINGCRLVYPMEGEAMRFLNHLGNVFFAKALSFVLGARLGDTLCGTKFFAKEDYRRMTAWREVFGDFDPFGDFEMLFPGAVLAMGIIDVPVRYRARTYGTTNISRFRHGLMLAKMTTIGFFRIKLGF